MLFCVMGRYSTLKLYMFLNSLQILRSNNDEYIFAKWVASRHHAIEIYSGCPHFGDVTLPKAYFYTNHKDFILNQTPEASRQQSNSTHQHRAPRRRLSNHQYNQPT